MPEPCQACLPCLFSEIFFFDWPNYGGILIKLKAINLIPKKARKACLAKISWQY
jgi:hypothetical protein